MAAKWTDLGARSRRSVQALTEAAPTVATDGVLLDLVGSIVPVLRAPEGQTFTGGSVRGYLWIDALARWIRCPRADDDLSDLSGLAEAALPALPVGYAGGRFALICDSVTLSSGTSVTLELHCAGRSARGEAL